MSSNYSDRYAAFRKGITARLEKGVRRGYHYTALLSAAREGRPISPEYLDYALRYITREAYDLALLDRAEFDLESRRVDNSDKAR